MMSYYQDNTPRAALSRATRAALRYVPLFILSVSMMATGFAQSTGSIRGKVKNLATGKYLTNASVVLVESGRSTSTDEYGEYRFNNVSPGEVTVKASYVGLGEKTVSVSVGEGVAIAGDIALFSARAGLEDEEVFELEAFTVQNSDFDSNAIAQQERKISSNLKLVQHADALGDIAEGNIGEFLKNMPGIAIDYVASDARAIKLRGMGAEFTNVTVDGASMASANSSGSNRSFELEQVSLSNVEQLEVYKLPRPDMPANSIGGSVNLVSKNAFAQGGRKISYKAFFTYNSTTKFDLGGTPGWVPDAKKSKIQPNVELSYSDVFLDDTLGVSLTYSQSNKFNVQQRYSPNGTYRMAADGTISSDRLQIQDGPKNTFRQSVAANFDYKLSENSILTLRTQRNWYEAEFANRNRNWRINGATAENGSIASGDFHNGSSINGSHRNKAGETDHMDIGAKHTFGDWKIDYGMTYSKATNRYRDFDIGYAEGVEIRGFGGNGQTLELDFQDSSSSSAQVIARDSGGTILSDLGLDLDNGYVNYLQTRPFDSTDRRGNLRLNVTREFDLGENNASIKFGFDKSSWERFRINRQIRYMRDSGANIADLPASYFRDEVYANISPGYGFGGFDWPSQAQVYNYFVANPGDFNEYTVITNTNSNIGRQYSTRMDLEEDVTSYYLMGSIGFQGDRGMITAGIRREETDVVGYVPFNGQANYTIDANGNLAGEFFEENTNYGTNHPSVHVRYNITDKLVGRLSYANTIGRANFSDMFGPATITDRTDTENGDGNFRINVKNAGLEPRRSDNLDLTLEYYFGDTSMVSASVFQNDMENFIGTASRVITTEDAIYYGLSETTGFVDADTITRTVNAGDAKVRGLELSWNQSLDLDSVPEFLKASSFYANATLLDLKGNFTDTNFSADVWKSTLPGFAKETISYGFLFKKKPFSMNFRWNIRGEETQTSSTTVEGVRLYRKDERRQTLDITADYKLNDRLSFYVSMRNASNAPYRVIYETAGIEGAVGEAILYREEIFGSDMSFGVKGSF